MMEANVALVGVTHPHSGMYLESLEAIDEVGGVVLVDPDEAARRAVGEQTRKLRASYGDPDSALRDAAVTHVVVALPNDLHAASDRGGDRGRQGGVHREARGR